MEDFLYMTLTIVGFGLLVPAVMAGFYGLAFMFMPPSPSLALDNKGKKLSTKCPRCGWEKSMQGTIIRGGHTEYYSLVFRANRLQSNGSPQVSEILASGHVSCCLHCGLIRGKIGDKETNYGRLHSFLSYEKPPAGAIQPECLCCTSGNSVVGKVVGIFLYYKRGGRYETHHFKPKGLKFKLLGFRGVKVWQSSSFACLDCNTYFMELDPIELVSFIKKNCQRDLVTSALGE